MVGFTRSIQAKSLLSLFKQSHELNDIYEFMCRDYDKIVEGMDKGPVGDKTEM